MCVCVNVCVRVCVWCLTDTYASAHVPACTHTSHVHTHAQTHTHTSLLRMHASTPPAPFPTYAHSDICPYTQQCLNPNPNPDPQPHTVTQWPLQCSLTTKVYMYTHTYTHTHNHIHTPALSILIEICRASMMRCWFRLDSSSWPNTSCKGA